MQYGHNELFQLLNSNKSNRLYGYEIKKDGIWIAPLSEEDRQYLTPDEIVAMYEPFRAHDTTRPVLALPCLGKELAHFLAVTGFDAMIIEPVDLSGETPQQPDNKSLLRLFVEHTADRLYRETGKLPQYTAVLMAIRSSANNEDDVGGFIEDVSLSGGGVVLAGGVNIAKSTIQNWLTAYRKTIIKTNA